MRKGLEHTAADPADRRRLVLGAAVGYGVDDIRVFVESLRASGYSGDVGLLIGWPGLAIDPYLRGRDITAVRILHVPFVTRSINARRYGVYARWLRARAARYDQVMLTDTRDVVIQRNPFEGITDPSCHYFLEGSTETIRSEPFNWGWVEGCLPQAQAAALGECRISCSGITIGGTEAMLAYLERMAALVHTVPIYRRVATGYDQALHNLLVHRMPDMAGTFMENNRHIATMALAPRASYAIDAEGIIRMTDGYLPAICHQYDRHPDLLAAVTARYVS